MTRLTVDIVSDVMCPWCYIGKKRLETAIASLDPSMEIELAWRPFQLDPTLPKEGKDRRRYLAEKFGSPERAGQAYASIREAGAVEGIPFDFEAIKVSSNTLDAHRLIRWAASAGDAVQDRVVERLFRMYFIEGKNIGDNANLLEAASAAGMDEPVVRALLDSDKDRTEVLQEIDTAQRMGVTGVPCFILDRRYAVMGAQPAEALARAINELAAQKNTA